MILRPHPEQSGRQVKFSKYVNEGVLIVCCLLSDPTPWNLWLSPASTYMTTWSILSLQLLSQYGAANVQLSRHHKRMEKAWTSSKSNQKTKVSMAFRSQSLYLVKALTHGIGCWAIGEHNLNTPGGRIRLSSDQISHQTGNTCSGELAKDKVSLQCPGMVQSCYILLYENQKLWYMDLLQHGGCSWGPRTFS